MSRSCVRDYRDAEVYGEVYDELYIPEGSTNLISALASLEMDLFIEKHLVSESGLFGGEGGSGVAIQGWNAELLDASPEAENNTKRLTISRILKVSWFLI